MPKDAKELQPVADRSLDIYCIAIGGTGMAPLACLLQGLGHRVRGSDGPLYPPMSTLLEEAGIRPLEGYDPAHLEPPPDLVIVGNAVARGNPEAEAVEASGLERISMPQALDRFLLAGRRSLVVAGTHGKTTTTAMAAHVWSACGRDPGYLIGGLPHDLPGSFHRGSGERFIIEGDEYNAAYFDRGPKFLHYRPQTVILTSVEYDHVDLYPNPESLTDAYRRLVRLPPADGLLVAWGDRDEVRRVAAEATCPVRTYGLDEGNDVHPVGPVEARPDGTSVRLRDAEAGEVTLHLRLPGPHNLLNALAVWTAARADGLPADAVVDALGRFRGVRRRLDELGSAGGVTVVEDFAHHPTAVERTLEAVAQRYPGRRRVVLYEPRTNSAGRELFHDAYRRAFAEADVVLFAPIFHAGRLGPEERLDLEELAAELRAAGVTARSSADYEDLLATAVEQLRPGDVVLTMSSGAFADLPHRLLAALEQSQTRQSRLEQA